MKKTFCHWNLLAHLCLHTMTKGFFLLSYPELNGNPCNYFVMQVKLKPLLLIIKRNNTYLWGVDSKKNIMNMISKECENWGLVFVWNKVWTTILLSFYISFDLIYCQCELRYCVLWLIVSETMKRSKTMLYHYHYEYKSGQVPLSV